MIGNYEVEVRCPFCGDSVKNPHKKHGRLNTRYGLYYCFRCGYGAKLPETTLRKYWSAFIAEVSDVIEEEDQPDITPGAGSPRPASVDRYHTTLSNILWDVFENRTPEGKHAGWLLRHGREMLTIGRGGFVYSGENLYSSPSDPLIVVEGPYDIISPRHTAVGRMISKGISRTLKGQCIIIHPDSDAPIPVELFQSPFISSIGVLLSEVDPDEASEILYLPRKELLHGFKILQIAGRRRASRLWKDDPNKAIHGPGSAGSIITLTAGEAQKLWSGSLFPQQPERSTESSRSREDNGAV